MYLLSCQYAPAIVDDVLIDIAGLVVPVGVSEKVPSSLWIDVGMY